MSSSSALAVSTEQLVDIGLTEPSSPEFGEFVSVPASEDPLRSVAHQSPTPSTARLQPDTSLLDELLAHEDDPMYFHRSASQPISPSPTPIRTSSPEPSESILTSVSNKITDKVQSLVDIAPLTLLQDLSEASRTPLTETPPIPSHSAHQRAATSSEHHSRHIHVREASLPASPPRPSPPSLSHAQSHSTFTTPGGTANTPSRWMTSLLSASSSHSSTSTSHIQQQSHDRPSPSSSTFHRANTLNTSGSALTHGTPFARHPYVPPSGAPGFGGDHEWDKNFEFVDDSKAPRSMIVLTGRNPSTAEVLTPPLASELRPYMPALVRLQKSWKLLYALDQHGISLQTLYARCGTHTGGMVLAIKDSRGATFGAWLGEGIRAGKGEGYFGSGESFLWKQGMEAEKSVQVFRWTGRNDYVALCEPDYLALGGGDGTYGLYLDDALCDGSSARCPTFDNEPLCSSGGPRRGRVVPFECVGVEVWAIER